MLTPEITGNTPRGTVELISARFGQEPYQVSDLCNGSVIARWVGFGALVNVDGSISCRVTTDAEWVAEVASAPFAVQRER